MARSLGRAGVHNAARARRKSSDEKANPATPKPKQQNRHVVVNDWPTQVGANQMADLPPGRVRGYGSFQVDFPNLIQVLGRSLYTTPTVAIRELIQNASDSLVARQATRVISHPAIFVRADPKANSLVIEDNGIGMKEDDVVRGLASIGGSGTRNLRKKYATSNAEAARLLMGQFGIGFLSAFVIADRVIIDTLSVEPGARSIQWVCDGTSEYELRLGERTNPGTRVQLSIKAAHGNLVDEAALRNEIVRYGDLITFPIYLNDYPDSVNRMHAPWHVDGTEAEYSAYIHHRYGVVPLAIFPVDRRSPELSVQGVLFIPPSSAEWNRRLRGVDLFQQRMYVSEDFGILPEWAGFINGVLDCDTIQLVTSREKVITNNIEYRALQAYLEETAASLVRRLAEEDRPTFLEVIRQHSWPVKWGAVRNDLFFEQVRDLIPFRTNVGPMVMPTYLDRVPERLGVKTAYYASADEAPRLPTGHDLPSNGRSDRPS